MSTQFAVVFLSAVIVAGTPMLLAGLGELLAERSGVLNLGVEGMMLAGALAGFATVQLTGSPWLALAGAAAAAAALAAVHAVTTVTFGLNQVVSGLAIVMLGTGLTAYLGGVGDPPLVGQPARATFRPVELGMLSDLPVVGSILFTRDPVVYLSWAAILLVLFYLRRTRPGLRLQAVGDAPATADAMGIGVIAYRYAHVLAGGAFAGFGGAYISIVTNPSWQTGLTAGQGWIALALVIFAGWRPVPLLVGAYLFGALRHLDFTLQAAGIDAVSPQILRMLPFLAAGLILVALSGRRARLRRGAPLALARHYEREKRE